ncbi:MAG: hypothetical protein PHU80_06875 [Kiritimatiellae bacterium]|nr:hypothetical protein [Kiritimatiellia bacterium]
MKYEDVSKLELWAGALQNVFTMSDLKILFGDQTEAALYKKLAVFLKDGVLIKVMRGVYATPGASLDAISNRINPDSYVSTGTVLARSMVIGTVPTRKIQALKIGRSRLYDCALGTVEHISLIPALYFGFEVKDGVKYATPEKAFLDACYLFSNGKAFPFDLDTDVNCELLNWELIQSYLLNYDRRFVDFFNQRWS